MKRKENLLKLFQQFFVNSVIKTLKLSDDPKAPQKVAHVQVPKLTKATLTYSGFV